MFRVISGNPTQLWFKSSDKGEAVTKAQHLSLDWPGVYFEVRVGEGYSTRVVGYMHGNESAPPAG